jgi:hypothetical protein
MLRLCLLNMAFGCVEAKVLPQSFHDSTVRVSGGRVRHRVCRHELRVVSKLLESRLILIIGGCKISMAFNNNSYNKLPGLRRDFLGPFQLEHAYGELCV